MGLFTRAPEVSISAISGSMFSGDAQLDGSRGRM